MRMKTHLLLPNVFCVVTIILLGCGSKEAPSKKDSTIPVTLGKVKAMDVHHIIKQVGTLEANETVLVKSEAKGKINQIFFEEGNRVKGGEILVKLDDLKIKAEVASIESRIVQYQAELVNTKRNVLRNMDLIKDGVTTQREYDDIITKKEVGEAMIKEAEANLALAKEQLKDTSINAPFNGFASERLVSIGDYIAVGDPIVKVVQTDPLKLAFRIPEKYDPSIKIGKKVLITVEAYPKEEFHGTIYFISPDVDTSTRTFLVKTKIPNQDNKLNPGMFANATLTTEIHHDATVIPWEALVVKEDETYVFKIDSDIAKKVPVKNILVFDGQAEVEGDLSPGSSVVKEGKFSLKDGDRISEKGKDFRHYFFRTLRGRYISGCRFPPGFSEHLMGECAPRRSR
ncbi:MAG: efflux RND transporter periplasmic adaptor subunit [Deltaproteobacteria bacterium]|nr:efflux RND transporter periplasmic adaptor subunit [Deltaproteobacteria bacterium]